MDQMSDQATVRCCGDLQLGVRQSVNSSARLTAASDEIRIDSPLENLVLSCEEVEAIEQVTWHSSSGQGRAEPSGSCTIVPRVRTVSSSASNCGAPPIWHHCSRVFARSATECADNR